MIRLDDLHRKGYMLYQDSEAFCFGVDAVLLSGFARVKRGENVLDLCSGNGIVPILLEAKTKGRHFTGLELMDESCQLAEKSIAYNGLGDKIDVIRGDLRNHKQLLQQSAYHVVTSNPPYVKADSGAPNESRHKALAKHELECTLADLIRAVDYALMTNGRFYLVHRPQRLCDLLCTLREYKIEPKLIRFVHAKTGSEPSLVLIEAVKNAAYSLKVLKPLFIYKEDGSYTDETHKIYYE